MVKKYATSVYSQKSTASAKSHRSYFSFTTNATIWPLFTSTTNDEVSPPETLGDAKRGIWKNLKSWMPLKKIDNDAITIMSSSGSISSSTFSTSHGKWKKLLVSPTRSIGRNHDNSTTLDKKAPGSLLHDMDTTLTSFSTDTSSISSKAASSSSHQHRQPTGILVNGGGTAEEIAEQNNRRRQRRLYLMRLQQPSSHRPSISSSIDSIDTSMNASSYNSSSNSNGNSHSSGGNRRVVFGDFGDSSSPSPIVSTPEDDSPTLDDKPGNDDDLSWYSAPRVMFVEPSPVPRFRNEPPAPPPSPPFLNIIVRQPAPSNTHKQQQQLDSAEDQQQCSMNADENNISNLSTVTPQQMYSHTTTTTISNRPRLIFNAPLHRGQTIVFSLQNTIPGDHIIVYKFLTSNSKLFPRRKRTNNSSKSIPPISSSIVSSSWTPSSPIDTPTLSSSSSTERYFVRPSAGRMGVGETHSDIRLFLNQVPPLAPGDILKDKILLRWAVIQRGTQVEKWAQQLKDSTRRKWLEMLLDTWPDQVVERKTRISIRFI